MYQVYIRSILLFRHIYISTPIWFWNVLGIHGLNKILVLTCQEYSAKKQESIGCAYRTNDNHCEAGRVFLWEFCPITGAYEPVKTKTKVTLQLRNLGVEHTLKQVPAWFDTQFRIYSSHDTYVSWKRKKSTNTCQLPLNVATVSLKSVELGQKASPVADMTGNLPKPSFQPYFQHRQCHSCITSNPWNQLVK